MFCTKCGKQLEDNVSFCIYCGAKIEPLGDGFVPLEPAPNQPQTAEPTPYQSQTTEPTPYQPQEAEPTPYQPQETEPTPYQSQEAEPTPYQPQVAESAPYQHQTTADQQDMTDSVVPHDEVKPKKKVPVKLIVAAALVVVIAIGAVVTYMLLNSPTAKMNRALESGDLEEAYNIFEANLHSDDLSDHSIELLIETTTKIRDDYLAGTITYDKAMEDLFYIRLFDCDEVSRTLSSATDTVQTHHQILTQLDAAKSYYQSGSYAKAIAAYEEILALDPTNAEATSGLAQAKAAYYDDQFSQAEDLVAQGYYEDAISIYQQALSEDPSNTAAADGLKAAEDAYRNEIIATADELAAKGDFDGALRTIEKAMKGYFADDAELAKALDDLHDREIGQMTDDVYDAADGGDWDGALELLDKYQKRYPADQALQEVREDILRKMPITLKNLTTVSSKSLTVLTSVVTDRWGNVYNGAVRYNASSDAYGLYNLDKRYVTFAGTVFVPTEATNGKKLSIAVYLDEELVYYRDDITEETPPIPFEINVTGATTMRIVTDNTGSSSYGYLYFANTSFIKVEDAATE